MATENGIGMFMWGFNMTAVPEYAFNGVITNFGIDYILKDSKTGELLEVDGSFSFNESLDLSDMELEDLGEGVTVNPVDE